MYRDKDLELLYEIAFTNPLDAVKAATEEYINKTFPTKQSDPQFFLGKPLPATCIALFSVLEDQEPVKHCIVAMMSGKRIMYHIFRQTDLVKQIPPELQELEFVQRHPQVFTGMFLFKTEEEKHNFHPAGPKQHGGHMLFMINPETGKLEKADPNKSDFLDPERGDNEI